MKKASVAKEKPAKKPGRKPMTAEEKAANAKARAEAKKKAAVMTPTLTMQYCGRDIDVKTADRCTAVMGHQPRQFCS